MAPAASEWATARGEKWRAHLAGMEATLRPIDEPLISALQLDAPHRIAELGCGGGGTTMELLRCAPPGSVIHGFDISPGLIATARERQSPGDAVVFTVADLATSAPERPYDRLVSRFGVMFFDDPPAAFSNLSRWLAPGGRFALAVWGRLSENAWMTSVRDVVAHLIERPGTDHDAPGPFRYADVDKLVALLTGAGFTQLDARAWRGVLPIGGALPPAEAARFALASFSSFDELLAKAGERAIDEARRALTERLSRHQRDGAVQLDASVWIVTGAR